MIVTWYVAVKVEAAREGLAHEREVVQRLNQPIDDVISLLESDDEEVFDRSVDTIGSYRPSSCKQNAIILFFEPLPSLKEPRSLQRMRVISFGRLCVGDAASTAE